MTVGVLIAGTPHSPPAMCVSAPAPRPGATAVFFNTCFDTIPIRNTAVSDLKILDTRLALVDTFFCLLGKAWSSASGCGQVWRLALSYPFQTVVDGVVLSFYSTSSSAFYVWLREFRLGP